MTRPSLDAVVVGSGPNGLAAAVRIAAAGFSVRVLEGQPTIGGGTRSAELTAAGFLHDLCSAVHPLGIASPYFKTLGLEKYGLEWIHPTLAAAHPLDEGSAAIVTRSLDETAARLGPDANAYKALFQNLVRNWDALTRDALGPLLRIPKHPMLMASFGIKALRSLEGLACSTFKTEEARALLAGHGAHSILPLDFPATAAIALILGAAAHADGWPIARGGSQKIADALAAKLKEHGGTITASHPVRTPADLPDSRVVLFDLTPRQLSRILGDRLPPSSRARFEEFQYGPGIFKIDWALNAPIPWKNHECSRAGTVHLGGTLAEIMRSERQCWEGSVPERPFVLLAQPTLFDPSRAPQGKHIAWAYCHVPHGCDADMTARIEAQIERFAPGFGETILARATASPSALEARNENLIGGDITGGANTLAQIIFRPAPGLNPYRLPLPGYYICSSSTPPGAGVHGMCGYHAAGAALKELKLPRTRRLE